MYMTIMCRTRCQKSNVTEKYQYIRNRITSTHNASISQSYLQYSQLILDHVSGNHNASLSFWVSGNHKACHSHKYQILSYHRLFLLVVVSMDFLQEHENQLFSVTQVHFFQVQSSSGSHLVKLEAENNKR